MTLRPQTTLAGLAALALLACHPAPAPAPTGLDPNSSPPTTMTTAPPCRAVLSPSSDGEYRLQFELSNATGRPIALDTYEPFLQLQVRATADGAPLTVEQPTLDIGIQPTTLTVPASGKAELATPLRLRFHPSGPPARDGFVWSIAHAPKGVELTFTLQLPAPFDQPFTARL